MYYLHIYTGLSAEDTTAAAVEVVGYWMTLDITSLKYDPPNQLISLKPGKSDPSIGKKGNITAGMLEELVTSTKQSTILTLYLCYISVRCDIH